MMNLFEKSLFPYKQLSVKQSREIKFSHGGHLFACANSNMIHVYKFYHPENPMNFKGHHGMIRCIAWLDDDSGFVSSGWDASIYVWKLSNGSEDNKATWEYKIKGVNFTSLTTYKPDQGSKHLIYATDTLRCLRELQEGESDKNKITKFEQQNCLQQVVLMHNRRAIFGGVGGGTQEQNKPGSIQVIRHPFEKTFEI